MLCNVLVGAVTLSGPVRAEVAQEAETRRAEEALSRQRMLALLSGEFSAWRGDADASLAFYMHLLELSPSAELAERISRLAFHEQKFAAMLKASQLWQQEKPSDLKAKFFYAVALAKQQQFMPAFSAMGEVLAANGETDFTRLVNILILEPDLNKQLLGDIASELQALSKKYKQSYDLKLSLALIAYHQGQRESFRRYAVQARDLSQNNSTVLQFVLRLFAEMQMDDELAETYQQALALQPDDLSLRHRYALFLSDIEPDLALEQLEILHDLDRQNGQYLLHIALLNLELMHLDDAEQSLYELMLFDEYHQTAAYYLALLAYENGEGRKALQFLIQVDDDSLLVKRYQLALQVNLHLKRYEQALVEVRALRQQYEIRLQNQGGHFQELLLTQASIEQVLLQPEDALLTLNAFARLNPDSATMLYQRAIVYQQLNRMNKAEADLRLVLESNPDDVKALNALGHIIASDELRYDEALLWLNRAVMITPNDVQVLDSLGWVLYRMGRAQEAKSFLVKANALSGDAAVAARFAEVLWHSGERNRAKGVLQEAYADSPNHEVLTDTIRRLDVSID